jgi:predicted acetyltransferase
MDVEVRKLRPEEGQAFVESVGVPFLSPVTGDPDSFAEEQDRIARTETDRAWVAEEAGRFVGNSCIHTMDLTLPGEPGRPCPVTPMAGISAVGVHPTHRRRGLLGQLMVAMLDDARSRGEAVAGLIASESSIYGRFGFGLATDMAELTINSRQSTFSKLVPEIRMQLLDRDEAAKVLPDLYNRQRRSRAGEVSRSEPVWKEILSDRPNQRGGGSGLFFAACDNGYVAYRAHEANILRGDLARVVVSELRGTDPETEAALWRFVLDLDLVGQVTVRRRPLDEPVRWRLEDPRQLQVTGVEDRLYVRILDVPKALTARRYRRAGRVTIDLMAPSVGEGGRADPALGRWVLEADTSGAECRRARSGEDADVLMEITDLGSLFLGGFAASLLAGAGRIEELTPGCVDALDYLFSTSPSPLTGTGF